MTDFGVTAFEPFTITNSPSTTLYRDGSYRSDREYLDASGARWVYVGMCDGDPLWRRKGEQAAWNINTVVDQFGPLTEAARCDDCDGTVQAVSIGLGCACRINQNVSMSDCTCGPKAGEGDDD
ncbi:hypothetical protein [Streptomyces sp. NPDC056682]|uniref:hypothetical protein n=1 Tax=Streptomyces sp. NPDC056682 TaxID=3345909 RepID=UPI0036B3ABCB